MHIKASCERCGAYIKFLKQEKEKDIRKIIIPFNTYKGMTAYDAGMEDKRTGKNYFRWMATEHRSEYWRDVANDIIEDCGL